MCQTEPNERHFLPVWNEMSDGADEEPWLISVKSENDLISPSFPARQSLSISRQCVDVEASASASGFGLIGIEFGKVASNLGPTQPFPHKFCFLI